jgi:hypothetical protein
MLAMPKVAAATEGGCPAPKITTSYCDFEHVIALTNWPLLGSYQIEVR